VIVNDEPMSYFKVLSWLRKNHRKTESDSYKSRGLRSGSD
jgi:hypothetical protein